MIKENYFYNKLYLRPIHQDPYPDELKDFLNWLREENFIFKYIHNYNNLSYYINAVFDFGEDIMEMINVSIIKNESSNYKINWFVGLEDQKSKRGNNIKLLKIEILKLLIETEENKKIRREKNIKIQNLIRKYGLNYKKYLNEI